MAPKRDLDALEDGELCFSTNHLSTKRSKYANLSSSSNAMESSFHIVSDSPIFQPSIQPPSLQKYQSKKRSFEDLNDDDCNEIHTLSKRFKLLSSCQEKEFLPLNIGNVQVEAESAHIWCTKIAHEITEYIPTSPAADSDSSSSPWSTSGDDVSNCTPSKEPYSEDKFIDDDVMDVGDTVSGLYDPTEGIYDAVLQPKTKDGTFEVTRQRTLEILQILNAERSKKYPSLWLRSLCQILHAVVIAAERADIYWHLTSTEKEDLQKIAKVMENIAATMPDWNKPNFPVKLLRNVNVRFMTGRARLQLSNLLNGVVLYFETDSN